MYHAGFGIGSMIAPILVSWDLKENESFHYAYWIIGAFTIVACLPTILYDSPRPTKNADGSAISADPPKMSVKEFFQTAIPGGKSHLWLWLPWYGFFGIYGRGFSGFSVIFNRNAEFAPFSCMLTRNEGKTNQASSRLVSLPGSRLMQQS